MSAISSKPFASISSVALAYICVVLMFVCPSIRLTTSMRMPCSSALVVERVAAHVVGDRLVDSDLDGDSFQDAVTVGDVGHRQYEVRSRDLASVFVDDAFGNAA